MVGVIVEVDVDDVDVEGLSLGEAEAPIDDDGDALGDLTFVTFDVDNRSVPDV